MLRPTEYGGSQERVMGRRMCVVQSAFGVYAVRSDRPHAPPGAAGRCVETLEGERSLMSTPAIKDGGPVTKVCFGSAPLVSSVSQCHSVAGNCDLFKS